MERPLVQILVVVANTQVGTLRTEVGKGSVRTAVGHGLFDPKEKGKPVKDHTRCAVSEREAG